MLSEETDPNKLHDLSAELSTFGIYTPERLDAFMERFLAGVDRDQLDPMLDECAAEYLELPDEDDLSAGILETIDMDSYRVEKREAMKIALADEDGLLDPVLTEGGGAKPEPDLEHLSDILRTFNDQFGNIAWEDEDRVRQRIEELPRKVAEDEAYQNAQRNDDPVNARIESDKALARVMISMMRDETQLFKQFSDNASFKRWLADSVFGATYGKSA